MTNRGLESWCTPHRVIAVVFLTVAICYGTGDLIAEEREPDIVIEVGNYGHDELLGFSADGSYLSVEGLSTVRRYNFARRRFDQQLAFPPGGTFAISNDGAQLARIDSVEVQIIDFESGDLLHVIESPIKFSVNEALDLPPYFHRIAFSDDDDHLFVQFTQYDGHLFWEPHASYVVHIESGTWTKCTVAFIEPTDCATATIIDGTVVALRKTRDVDSMAFSLSSDRSKLLLIERHRSGEDELVLRVWDTHELSPLSEPWVTSDHTYPIGEGDPPVATWLGNRPIVLYAMPEPSAGLTVLDVHGRAVLLSLALPFYPDDVVLSPDGQWLALSGIDSSNVWVYALDKVDGGSEAGAPMPRLVPQVGHGGSISGLTVSDDGRIVATAGEGGWVSLWERASGREFRRLPSSGGEVALSQDGSQVLRAGTYSSEGSLWDIASGEVRQHLDFMYGVGDIFATFLAGGTKTLFCDSMGSCMFRPLSDDAFWEQSLDRDDPGIRELAGAGFEYRRVSLAPDESSVALALGADGLGWMELDADGRHRVFRIPRDVEVGGVAALEGARVIAGLSNGDVLLIDVDRGAIMRAVRTRKTEIGPITRLNNTRIAVASQGSFERPYQDWEILIVSLRDLSVLQRLTFNQSIASGYDISRATTTYIERLAASGDGRWLAAALANSQGTRPIVQLWDTTAVQDSMVLGSHALPIGRVEFDSDSNLLLVDSDWTAALWNLKDGHIVRQFRHGFSVDGETLATITNGTVVYAFGWDKVASWSIRSGLHEFALPETGHYLGSSPVALDAEGSRIGVVSLNGLALLSIDELGAYVKSVRRDGLGTRRTDHVRLYAAADVILLNRGKDGVEALNLANAESIWWRKDVVADYYRNRAAELMLTADYTGVVAMSEDIWSESEDNWLLVLEAADGTTRYGLQYMSSRPIVPVIKDDVVQEVLRLTDDLRVERLSLKDGLVMGSANLGIASLSFAVSDRAGKVYLVADGSGQVVLWNTDSDERTVLRSTAVAAESVAFAPVSGYGEGRRVLAIAETDGTVALWDLSGGLADLREPLARLITFEDGDWAMVGADGRYDASDPADLEDLAWVMPDAPTEPVPLSVFYRDYYEPQLLPRLLAGETFEEIRSIADLDREQPRVEISVEPAGSSRVNVTVEVSRGEAGGVGDLKLFRDGRLVGCRSLAGGPEHSSCDLRFFRDGPVDEPDESAGQSDPGAFDSDSWTVSFADIVLPTAEDVGAVEFSAYAFNADGVKSETHRLDYAPPETAPKPQPKPRRAFVIVVGVNAYQNEAWDLHYAVRDAEATQRIVADRLRGSKAADGSKAFDEVHTVSLTAKRDESGNIVGTATRADLLAVLDVLAGKAGDWERLQGIPGADSLAKAGPDDLVYLAFSGHGLSGDKGRFHLFLSDIGDGVERVVDDTLLKNTLDSDLLAHYLRQVDAGDFVLVIDACNAAASVEGGGFKPGPMGSRGLGQLAYDKGMRVLAASQAEEVALESGELRHGLLTYAMVLEGLAGGAADRAPMDQAIDFSEMMNYAVERVPLLYADIESDDFAPQGKGGHSLLTASKRGTWSPVQRPRLFDFSRTTWQVRMAVTETP